MIEDAGFTYDPADVVPNSMPSLELAELARDAGRFRPVHAALFDAYWSRRVDIGNTQTLRQIAVDSGLDAAKIEEALADGRYKERIASTTQVAYELGFGGVPAWLVDDRLMISGAQPHEEFERAMSRLGYEPTSE
jgi:predicted DsbA family dithiol-disulfide isomerase